VGLRLGFIFLGKAIVCNGDYGATKWRGIADALVDYKGRIVSTSARMNDYYLKNMERGAWQYTMCHEIGHTLGLGHTDEDFDNEDLGNCMDYTNNLDANKHPDTMNFEELLEIYGPISTASERRHLRRRDDSSASGARTDNAAFTTEGVRMVPKHIRERRREAIQNFDRRIDGNLHEGGWDLVHQKHNGEKHEKYLGDGYKLRVQLILAD